MPNGLSFTVAFSVGFAIVIAVLRIIRGWPIQYLMLSSYLIVVLMTMIASSHTVGYLFRIEKKAT